MKRIYAKISVCLLGALLASVPAGYARQLSLDEAIRNAPGKYAANPSRSMPELLYTESTGELNVAYVLAAGNDGYVVLAADDVLPAVLGYSDAGGFDADCIPPAMEAWMQEYGRQLTYALNNGLRYPTAARAAAHPAIAPLCKAVWNQSTPFNNNCPIINGKHSPTGCNATAMAQVMYAHKWPVTGTGTNTYTTTTLREERTFDFGATTFDWDNMLPHYPATGYTAEQGAAVATLLEACGNAALMNYGESASGAYAYNAIYGMVNFLKYDRSALLVLRNYYKSAVWDEMIYNELAAGRPVIYGGYTADYASGHSFVVDGYSKDGYYHLNWGWNGLSNGYFLLSALDPADQGIGGSSSGYNYNQDAILNVMPAKEDSQSQLEVFWDGAFTTEAKNYPKNGWIHFIVGSDGGYQGSTLETVKATMGIKLTPSEGGETVFYAGSTVEFPAHYGSVSTLNYKDFFISAASLPTATSGEYIATPAFRFNDEVKDVAVRVGEVSALKLTFRPTGVRIEEISADRTLTADNIRLLTPLYSGKSCSVSADIHNTGTEYLGMVKAGLSNSGGDVLSWLGNVPVNVPDGETVSVGFSGTLVRATDGEALATGEYTLNVYDEAGNAIGSPQSVTVSTAPAGKPVYNMSISVDGVLSGDGTAVDPYLVHDSFNMNITVDVISGLFEDAVAIYAFDSYGNRVYFSGENSDRKTFFVGAGQTQTCTYVVGTANFETGSTLYIQPYGWTTDVKDESLGWFPKKIYVKRIMSGIREIEADDRSGICPNPVVSTTTVTATAPVTSIDVYSITGTRVMSVAGSGDDTTVSLDVAGLQSGHYVVSVKTVNGIETYRLIKR